MTTSSSNAREFGVLAPTPHKRFHLCGSDFELRKYSVEETLHPCQLQKAYRNLEDRFPAKICRSRYFIVGINLNRP